MVNEVIYRNVFKTVCSINFPRLSFSQFAKDVEQRMIETNRTETRANVKKSAVELAKVVFRAAGR